MASPRFDQALRISPRALKAKLVVGERVRLLDARTTEEWVAATEPALDFGAREDALLGGRARKRVEEFMERYGLDFSGGDTVASVDHVAVELAMFEEEREIHRL